MATVTLLWTGGWDSTFRLLQLLHDTEVQIQPLYLVDEVRSSTPTEINVMRTLRRAIATAWPDESKRLRPTEYGSYRATRIVPKYKEMWEALKERGRVGLQYPVLGSYAVQNGLDQVELCIEARENGPSTIHSILQPVVEQTITAGGTLPSVSDERNGPEALFRPFVFPVMHYTKRDMEEEARQRSWMPILRKTWFCFDPVMGFACGECPPCRIAREEKMDHRIGRVGPLLHRGRKVRHTIRVRGGALLRRLGVKSITDRALRGLGAK